MIKENKRIIFNGNGYSEDWKKEAAKRGLLNLTNTIDALPELVKPDVVAAFSKYKVMNDRELHARFEIALETYIKTINIEGQLMVLMANREHPAGGPRYQKNVAESVKAVKDAGGKSKEGKKVLETVTRLVDLLRTNTDKLAKSLEHHASSTEKHAKFMRDTVVPAMAALREVGDQLELVVPTDLWPLPGYREMLFVK